MKQLRDTFDQESLLYEKARPGYPEDLFDDILKFSKIPEDGKILEIGCGTAQATIPFARRDYSIHCIELGANLASVAERNLTSFPKAQVSVGNFETYPIQERLYDLVISATAFHWINPVVGYAKVAKILKSSGSIALFWNKPVQTQISAEYFQPVQDVYSQIVPEMADGFLGLPHPDSVPTPIKDEINRSKLFEEVTIHKYQWNSVYTAKSYTELLCTYSDHLALAKETRSELLQGIENLINSKFNGSIIKEYLSILYLAKRRADPFIVS